MFNLLKNINKKVNGLIWSLLSTGIVLMLLAVLIVWTNFILRLVMGLFILVLSYVFIYGAYRIWTIKKDIMRHFDIK